MTKASDALFDEAGGIWVFKPRGEVDISNADEMRERLKTAFEERRADIRVDMGELTYIDSTGLGVIIGTHDMLKNNGYRIFITNPKDNVKKLLKITNLYRVLVEE